MTCTRAWRKGQLYVVAETKREVVRFERGYYPFQPQEENLGQGTGEGTKYGNCTIKGHAWAMQSELRWNEPGGYERAEDVWNGSCGSGGKGRG